MPGTVVFRDERYLDHITTHGHPECAERLVAMYGVLDSQCAFPGFEVRTPREAARDEIVLNHGSAYIDAIEATAGRQHVQLDPDTSTSSGSWTAAKLAAGAVLDGCDMLLDDRAANVLALVRPPGHHAERDRAMGFCLFNNVAVGAHYLIQRHGLERVLVYDWDIHHGNGTQNAFYDMPQVLYVSSHHYPYYPGTGALHEVGSRDGRGYTVNIPLAGGQGDGDYLQIIEQVVVPLAREYKPQVIFVSAGYDIYERDPLGTMQVTAEGFGAMALRLKALADELCRGRLLLALEGGYHIEGIAQSMRHTLSALAGNNTERYVGIDTAHASCDRAIAEVHRVQAEAWPIFR